MYTLDQNIQRAIRSILGWTEEQYSQFIYDCGLAYLWKIAPEYPQIRSQISKSAIFWNWWKMHWENREKEFLEKVDDLNIMLIEPVEEYKELHDPRTLAEAIYLNGQVLQDSYVNLISEITTEQKEVAA